MPSPPLSKFALPRAARAWLALGLPAALALVVFAAQIHGLDFRVYREGVLALLGLNGHRLYDPSLIETDTRGLPFTYPPFAALIFVPFAFLPEAAGLALVTGASLICLVAVAAVVVGYLRRNADALPHRLAAALETPTGRGGAVVAAVLAIGILGPWREGLGFGQVNPMLMLLVLADLLRPATRVPRGVLIGLAAGLKLTPLAFGLIFLARRDWRSILVMGLTFAATIAAGFAAAPQQAAAFWTDALFDAERVGDTTNMYNVSLNSLVAHLGAGGALQRPLWLAAALAVIVLGYLAIRHADEAGDRLAAICANAVVMLAISPISWFHHWVWAALLLPVVYVSARRRTGRARAVGYGLAAVMVPVFLFSSVTITLTFTGVVLEQGPAALELFTGLGVLLPVAVLAWWLVVPAPHGTRSRPAQPVPSPR
ncbi:Polyprenol-phosphate-mannose-dependent alpha-(1-2)-phosphatidylinositol mannoside mannosyltransferase [Arthrobacter saudimassiliensis]|uniref:Polyprenol-phosphate-mannose-dependent alpha-(1-2)-phosphatidylinositol mannoside mannosyltransferase n=1 Tax=Arthrobacter saudimassiliensis TaxID=1461584 RepID=A0A078MKK8_9MICC|nr:Polyprenol-phosphate-mannose-dependent alpha-(1-2)-phosphatidylinositol mannoside mannosyltransferase [Arthrobacter saudimassiliensis]